jgi:D-arabinose 1-dehydrogenase-like Zn-dependent alcohol dehydrogenase
VREIEAISIYPHTPTPDHPSHTHADFCSKHGIVCEIETISIDYVNTAMERLIKSDVHYRFVIDIQGSLVNDYSV